MQSLLASSKSLLLWRHCVCLLLFSINVLGDSTADGRSTSTCPGWSEYLTHGNVTPSACSLSAVPEGTKCQFSCNDGYEFYRGALLTKTCNNIKGGAEWYPKIPIGHCHPIRCKSLQSDNNARFTPHFCNTKGVTSKQKCSFTDCPAGTEMIGPPIQKCGNNATWLPGGGTYCRSERQKLYCNCSTSVMHLKTEMGLGYANVFANLPLLKSNIDSSQLSVTPVDTTIDIRKVPTGSHMFTAELQHGLNAKSTRCSFRVFVKDYEPPVLEYCPSVIELAVTQGATTVVNFTNSVLFNDNVDGRNVRGYAVGDIKEGARLGAGVYKVTVKGNDSSANSVLCKFKIEIKNTPCFNFFQMSFATKDIHLVPNSNSSHASNFVAECRPGSNQSCDIFPAHFASENRTDFDGSLCLASGPPKCIGFVLDKFVPDCVAVERSSNGTCAGNKELINGQCVSCPSGFYFDKITNDCLLCPDNTTSDLLNPTKCLPCPTGMITKHHKGPRACQAVCRLGWAYNSTTNACMRCPVDTYAQYGALSCTPCPSGKMTVFSPASSEELCVYGISSGGGSMFDASSLDINSFPENITNFFVRLDHPPISSGGKPYMEKLAVTFSSAFLRKQDLCNDSFVQFGTAWREFFDFQTPRLCGTALDTVKVVPFRDWGETIVVLTVPNRTALDLQFTYTFINCLKGSFFNVSMMACNQCKQGYYQPRAIQLKCLKCPSGMTTLKNDTTVCVDICQSGYYRHGPSCVPCHLGTYRNVSDAEGTCSKCPVNTTTSFPTASMVSQCIAQCGAGEFVNDGICSPCVIGTYQDKTSHGSLSCKACLSGSTTLQPRSISPQACISECRYEGEYYDLTRQKCAPCPIGTFKFASDVTVTECSSCPKNHTTQNEGSVTRLDCIDTIDHCASKPCQSPGRCVDVGDGYACVCPLFHGGDHCEQDTSPCANRLCAYGATCIVTSTSSHHCECPPGKPPGSNCERGTKGDPCTPDPCQNNGVCSVPTQVPNATPAYKCQCTLDYSGVNCEIGTASDSCSAKPCHMKGTKKCVDASNAFYCSCSAGYSGYLCDNFQSGKYFERLEASVKLTDIMWHDDLTNEKSSDYVKLKSRFEDAIYDIHGLSVDFHDVVVTSFQRGSVIVNFTCYYHIGTSQPELILMKFIKTGEIDGLVVDSKSFHYVSRPAEQRPKSNSHGSSKTGIVVGVIVVLLVIGAVSLFLWWNTRRRRTRFSFDRIMNDTTHLHPNIELS